MNFYRVFQGSRWVSNIYAPSEQAACDKVEGLTGRKGLSVK